MFFQSDYRRDFDDLFGMTLIITKIIKKTRRNCVVPTCFILNFVSYAFFSIKTLTE